MRNDTSHYEIKMAILHSLMPSLQKSIVEVLFKRLLEVLAEPAENSIFKRNINPLRTGLILYKLVDDLQEHFNISEYTVEQIHLSLNNQLVAMLDSYHEPDEFLFLVE